MSRETVFVKRCTRCGIEQDRSAFYKWSHGTDGLQSWCRTCYGDYHQGNRSRVQERNARPETKDRRWANHLVRKYGITPAEYDEMFFLQRGWCAICDEPPTERVFVVDHNQQTGVVRGLLHRKCNAAIGQLRDDPLLLNRAAAYLRWHE